MLLSSLVEFHMTLRLLQVARVKYMQRTMEGLWRDGRESRLVGVLVIHRGPRTNKGETTTADHTSTVTLLGTREINRRLQMPNGQGVAKTQK
jgi:hypothetical protein